jgi:hypothetical protein
MRVRLVSLAIATALVVVGCSSSKGSTTSPTTGGGATTTTAASTSTTVPGPITATTVATKMIASGVPATIAFTYTAENDPNKLLGRQGGYTSKVSLQDNRLPKVEDFLSESASSTDGGAAIECYADSSGAQARYQELKGFSGTVLGDGYDYVSGPCVLRLSKDLTPTQASQYQQAFEAATK